MRTKNSVVNTVQDETIFCIIGGTPIYVDVVLELRRERRINVGRTCLFFRITDIYFLPHQHHTDYLNRQASGPISTKVSLESKSTTGS
jgi:hypothetical protein